MYLGGTFLQFALFANFCTGNNESFLLLLFACFPSAAASLALSQNQIIHPAL